MQDSALYWKKQQLYIKSFITICKFTIPSYVCILACLILFQAFLDIIQNQPSS